MNDLYSISGSGQIGRQWVYYVADGVLRRRAYIIPPDPHSDPQEACRARWRAGMIEWAKLSPEERAAYYVRVRKKKRGIWGVNLFMSEWIASHPL